MSKSLKEINRVKNNFIRKLASFDGDYYLNKFLKVADNSDYYTEAEVRERASHLNDQESKTMFLSEVELTKKDGVDKYPKKDVEQIFLMYHDRDIVTLKPEDYGLPKYKPSSWTKDQTKHIQGLLATVVLPGGSKPSPTGFLDATTLKAIKEFKSNYGSKAVTYDQLARDLLMARMAPPTPPKQPGVHGDLRMSDSGGPIAPMHGPMSSIMPPESSSGGKPDIGLDPEEFAEFGRRLQMPTGNMDRMREEGFLGGKR